jgi:hypothetical protein
MLKNRGFLLSTVLSRVLDRSLLFAFLATAAGFLTV